MAVPATPSATHDAAYFHSVYSKMVPPTITGPIYHAPSPTYAFTLATIRGKHISFEGVPGVGKTTLMHSCAAAIELFGGHAEAHEENADAEMLQQFFADPARNAFWFQMYKLRGRQMRAQANEHALLHGTRQDRTVMEDRDLPGDMAFAIYNHYKGFISDAQMRIYMKEATLTKFHAAFLTIMPWASPECLVQRVETRGDPNEIIFYDEKYFRVMDACYRAALQICGCTYCVVDWDESVPGVGSPGKWHGSKPMVPANKCLEVIEHAIAATYGENITRIDAMRGAKSLVIATSGGISLRTSDPGSIVTETKRLMIKYSTEGPRSTHAADDDERPNVVGPYYSGYPSKAKSLTPAKYSPPNMIPFDKVPNSGNNFGRQTVYVTCTNAQVMGGINRSDPGSTDVMDRFIVLNIPSPATQSNKATDTEDAEYDEDDDYDAMPPLEPETLDSATTFNLEDLTRAPAKMMCVSGDPYGMDGGNTFVYDGSDDSDDSMPELEEVPLEDQFRRM